MSKEQISEAIEAIKDPASQLMTVACDSIQTMALFHFSWGIVMFIVSIVMAVYCIKLSTKACSADQFSDTPYIVGAATTGALWIGFFVPACSFMYDLVYYFNPEMYLVRAILSGGKQ